MNNNQVINLSNIEYQSTPFDYFVGTEIFSEGFSLQMLNWLEIEAPWKLVKKDFYEQYEFNFIDTELPPHLSILQESSSLDFIRLNMEDLFQARLKKTIDFVAHKLIPGQTIRIHNDYLEGKETHRLLIQLNRGWDTKNGGFLMFFNSSNPTDIHRIILPTHNTIAGFKISPTSNHAVSTIKEGERYTLVYSFYNE
jgi:Rps23 Pro-64 3,4-dihydroxylase Tpa1-like proline 4-hydroxylase